VSGSSSSVPSLTLGEGTVRAPTWVDPYADAEPGAEESSGSDADEHDEMEDPC
jgi:hypothetical protein